MSGHGYGIPGGGIWQRLLSLDLRPPGGIPEQVMSFPRGRGWLGTDQRAQAGMRWQPLGRGSRPPAARAAC